MLPQQARYYYEYYVFSDKNGETIKILIICTKVHLLSKIANSLKLIGLFLLLDIKYTWCISRWKVWSCSKLTYIFYPDCLIHLDFFLSEAVKGNFRLELLIFLLSIIMLLF